MEILVLKQADRELKEAPQDVKIDIFSLFEDLSAGKKLSLPISRPLPKIGQGLHELRLSGRAGEYRVFYFIKTREAIYVIHAAKKKTQELDLRTVKLLKQRIRGLHL